MAEPIWSEDILRKLDIRDVYEKKDSHYFKAFAKLSQVCNNQEKIRSNSPSPSLTGIEDETRQNINNQLNEQIELLKLENESVISSLNQSTINIEKYEIKEKKMNRVNEQLESKISNLTQKINNLQEEIKEKNKTIEIINDENLINQIQNNVLNDQIKQLKNENESLIKRWMDKVKEDAEKLNDANQFLETTKNKSTNDN